MIDRRRFLGAAGAGLGLSQINPRFFIDSAYAQTGKPIVFLSAENITGNWDPTAHTTLSQKNIEGYVMGFLARFPMRPDDPGEMNLELAESIELLDPDRLEIKLKSGITFHDGEPFGAKDVKATFEYGAQPDRPAQWYPGPTGSFTVETPDEQTVIVDTSTADFGASLFIFLAGYLPMMSAKDVEGGPSGPLSQRLNGTGPFRFVEQRGNDTILEAFGGYFMGAPKVPGVTFSFVGDATTRILSMLNGQASIIAKRPGGSPFAEVSRKRHQPPISVLSSPVNGNAPCVSRISSCFVNRGVSPSK